MVNLVPGTWTPDGRQLLYYRETAGTTTNRPSTSVSSAPWIWVHDAATKKPPTAIEGPLANAGGAELSPDGRWIAYHSVESGQLQVYVQAYPGPGRRHQVSANGGISPIWRADGRELFYVRPNVLLPPLGSVEACTAAYVSAFQQYRDLFSTDVLAPGVAVKVGSMAILFTDLKDSTAMYGRIGDAPAFGSTANRSC